MNQLSTYLSPNPRTSVSGFELSQQQKDISIYDCDPGGNYTYIVYALGLVRTNYAYLDQVIKASYPHFEQGGFIESPTNSNCVLRLHMAGGEFCGNAIRCLAALIAQDYSEKRELLSRANYSLMVESLQELAFPIEISGVSQPLMVTCLRQRNGYLVRAEMPFNIKFSDISEEQIILPLQQLKTVVVRMQGITHILIDESRFPFLQSASEQRSLIKMAINHCQLQEEPAIGLIWYSSNNSVTTINPVVWVRDIDTCIYETACGSGTFALAINNLRNSSFEKESFAVKQPSGAVIKATASKSIDKAEFTSARIEGFVSLKSLPSLSVNLQDANYKNQESPVLI